MEKPIKTIQVLDLMDSFFFFFFFFGFLIADLSNIYELMIVHAA
jgi:hypothetical protein